MIFLSLKRWMRLSWLPARTAEYESIFSYKVYSSKGDCKEIIIAASSLKLNINMVALLVCLTWQQPLESRWGIGTLSNTSILNSQWRKHTWSLLRWTSIGQGQGILQIILIWNLHLLLCSTPAHEPSSLYSYFSCALVSIYVVNYLKLYLLLLKIGNLGAENGCREVIIVCYTANLRYSVKWATQEDVEVSGGCLQESEQNDHAMYYFSEKIRVRQTLSLSKVFYWKLNIGSYLKIWWLLDCC